MPRSPLPQRHGLDAAWVRTPREVDWVLMRDHLVDRLPADGTDRVDEMIVEGRFVDERGAAITAATPYVPHVLVWFHRDLPVETVVQDSVPVLYRDERIVVVDKPHFLSTIPRGQHVMQSVVVRMRDELGLPGLSPAHRLDRLTAGVLMLTTEQRWRAPYQQLFERRHVTKEYEAIAPIGPLRVGEARVVRSHIRKDRGVLQAYEDPDAAPNAETLVELVASRGQLGRYRLTPHTGRTHQLRVHLNSLGVPILDDPFYPDLVDVPLGDHTRPLQLLARRLAFADPIDDTERVITSARELTHWTGTTPGRQDHHDLGSWTGEH